MKHLITYTATAIALLTSCNKQPDYDATGIFEATTVTISAETQGKILSMDLEEGDSVVSGDIILSLIHI